MKAKQVAVLHEPKEYQECIICLQPTFAPYARVNGGKFLCSAKCALAYDTKLRMKVERVAKDRLTSAPSRT